MKTILLVDDEPNLRTLVRTTLEDPSFRILEGCDGKSAIEIANREHPDVILLDWMMPGMTGLEVVQALRLQPATAKIPIIMLTAKGQEKDRLQARALGIEAYLLKPFSPLELLNTVRAALDRTCEPSTVAAYSTPLLTEQVQRQLDSSDSQLALYARDLRRAVDSERVHAKNLAQANERLNTLNTLKTDFLAFISHEMRTPLNAMSAVDLFDPNDDPKDQAEIVQSIRSGYDRLHRFIARSLEYFNWLAIERVETLALTDLAALVRRVASERKDLSQHGTEFRLTAPLTPCWVQADTDDLQEVVEIILDNALKFSPHGKSIRVDITNDSDRVVFSVADKGVGLMPDAARDLFSPYTIQDIRHHSESSGLNLAIAQAIVKSHGGSIRVTSPGRGQGATFITDLPAARPAAAEMPSHPSTGSAARGS